MANCGAARRRAVGDGVSDGGPLPRHPSQLYEAALEGLVLFAVLALLMRAGALKRPGLIIGCFAVVYAIARTPANSSASPTPSSASCGAA